MFLVVFLSESATARAVALEVSRMFLQSR